MELIKKKVSEIYIYVSWLLMSFFKGLAKMPHLHFDDLCEMAISVDLSGRNLKLGREMQLFASTHSSFWNLTVAKKLWVISGQSFHS